MISPARPSRINNQSPYQATTIRLILDKLNRSHFIPDIQRDFEWRKDRIIRLYDSVLRDYPIGTFLFWHVEPQHRDDWRAYQFMLHYKEEMSHNRPAVLEGVQDLTLVLDGQQRLTSFYIGLYGTYRIRKVKGSHYHIESNWTQQRLYIDLLHDPSAIDYDSGDVLAYKLDFFGDKDVPAPAMNAYWFRIPQVLDFVNGSAFRSKLNAELRKMSSILPEVSEDQLACASRILTRLYHAVWKEPLITYLLEEKQDYDRALTIFLRTNHAGKPLTKSTLMFSIITARWRDIDVRSDLNNLVDDLNRSLLGRRRFSPDLVMKTSLMLSDRPVQYKIDNFNNAAIDTIYHNWDKIKSSIKTAVALADHFGLSGHTLLSANALIPVIYYLFHHEHIDLFSSEITQAKIAQAIKSWLLCSLINKTFGGQSDVTLTEHRTVLHDHKTSNAFPIDELTKLVSYATSTEDYINDCVKEALSSSFQSPSAFLILSLLYTDQFWKRREVVPNVDHIFPRDGVYNLAKSNQNNNPDFLARYSYFSQIVNKIGNLEILTEHENKQKRAARFEDWIKSRVEDFRDKHLIPKDETLYDWAHVEEFVAARQELIRQRLQDVLSPTL